MFKKTSFLLFSLIAIPCFAGFFSVFEQDIGPATSTTNVTVAQPGGGKQNCFIHFSADNSTGTTGNFIFRVLDNSTTVYQLLVTTGTQLQLTFPQAAPLCTSINSTTTITNSASSFDINYYGFVRKNN